MTDKRRIIDLVSVGKSIAQDLAGLGITEVEELIDRDAESLYQELRQKRGGHLDICCRDVFEAAIEQARDPELPHDQCEWWYYSRKRKAGK